jgi:hypothetical protein
VPAQFFHGSAPVKDEHSVTDARQVIPLRGQQQDRQAILSSPADQLIEVMDRPDVYSLGWFIEDKDDRIEAKPLAEQQLLLVPAAKGRKRTIWLCGHDRSATHPFESLASLSAVLKSASLPECLESGQREVFLGAECADAALSPPLGREVCNSGSHRIARCGQTNGPAMDPYVSSPPGLRTGQ